MSCNIKIKYKNCFKKYLAHTLILKIVICIHKVCLFKNILILEIIILTKEYLLQPF